MSLKLAELQSVAEQFAVSDEQVRRDHVISHLLALIIGEAVGVSFQRVHQLLHA